MSKITRDLIGDPSLDNFSEVPDPDASSTARASYPTDSEIVDFLRPPRLRLTSGR